MTIRSGVLSAAALRFSKSVSTATCAALAAARFAADRPRNRNICARRRVLQCRGRAPVLLRNGEFYAECIQAFRVGGRTRRISTTGLPASVIS